MSLASAAAALTLAAGLGAAWWGLAIAAALWAGMLVAGPLGRLLLAAAAPAVLTASTPVREVSFVALGGAAALAALALAPLLLDLGPTLPTRRSYLVAGAAVAGSVVFLLTPPGIVLAASDLATGALIVTMAATLLASVAFARSFR